MLGMDKKRIDNVYFEHNMFGEFKASIRCLLWSEREKEKDRGMTDRELKDSQKMGRRNKFKET